MVLLEGSEEEAFETTEEYEEEEEESYEELKLEQLKLLLKVTKTWRDVLEGRAPLGAFGEASTEHVARKPKGVAEGKHAKKTRKKSKSAKKAKKAQ